MLIVLGVGRKPPWFFENCEILSNVEDVIIFICNQIFYRVSHDPWYQLQDDTLNF